MSLKEKCRLDIRKYSFSQGTMKEWNKSSTDCENASSMKMFRNKIDKYCWTLDKSKASLSTFHLEF